MAERLARLEAASHEVKATLRRLEPMVERLVTLFGATVPHLEMTERFNRVDGLLAEAKTALATTENNLYSEISVVDNQVHSDIAGLRTEMRVGGDNDSRLVLLGSR